MPCIRLPPEWPLCSFIHTGNLTKHMKSKAHSKKCMEMGVAVGIIEDQDTEDSGRCLSCVFGNISLKKILNRGVCFMRTHTLPTNSESRNYSFVYTIASFLTTESTWPLIGLLIIVPSVKCGMSLAMLCCSDDQWQCHSLIRDSKRSLFPC